MALAARESGTRWYLIDTEVSAMEGYYCLCYEDDHLVQREYFGNRFLAAEFGEQWRYEETAD